MNLTVRIPADNGHHWTDEQAATAIGKPLLDRARPPASLPRDAPALQVGTVRTAHVEGGDLVLTVEIDNFAVNYDLAKETVNSVALVPLPRLGPEGPRYTVAVDFDGVLHSYVSGWCGAGSCPDPPVPGAIDWLNSIVKKFEVVILTTRGDQEGGNEAVRAWLFEHGYNGPDLRVTSQKVPALVYVDDRAWRFEGDNFPTPGQIHQAIPWNKSEAHG